MNVTTFKGRNGVIEEITREELDMLVHFDMAHFMGTTYDDTNRRWVDQYRYKTDYENRPYYYP